MAKTMKRVATNQVVAPISQEGSGPVENVKRVATNQAMVPASQEVFGVVENVKVTVSSLLEQAKETTMKKKGHIVALAQNPEFQKLTLSTSTGVVILGGVGGAFGAASGMLVGGAAGVMPALFTFGLSIPAGAGVGSITGFLVGSSTGGTMGAITGLSLYKYRIEIKDGIIAVKVKVVEITKAGRTKVACIVDETKATAKNKTQAALDFTKAKAGVAAAMAKEKHERVKSFVTAKSGELYEVVTTTRNGTSCLGALAGGSAGGFVGGSMGAMTGAAVGIVPALFTFGLSIPVGATIGLCTGAVAGSSMGVVGGGAAGFAGFTYRKEINSSVEKIHSTVNDSASYVRTKVVDSATTLRQNVSSYVKSGTGGTL